MCASLARNMRMNVFNKRKSEQIELKSEGRYEMEHEERKMPEPALLRNLTSCRCAKTKVKIQFNRCLDLNIQFIKVE